MQARAWFLHVLLFITVQASKNNSSRQPHLLNVFNIISFPNDGCSVNGLHGVCYSASECAAKGGNSGGSCASGFGVCCHFSGSCGGSTAYNNTYFTSASASSSPCSFSVCQCASDICFIRLDFSTFELSQPSSDAPSTPTTNGYATSMGQCQEAQFQISTAGPAAPTICGSNTGYHMIVEAEDSCNTLAMTWTSTDSQSWDIQISQISCTSEWRPPSGCLQYYTGTTGTIVSYNWQGGRHLASQAYSACVRTEAGYCSIGYQAVTADTDFQISAPVGQNQALQGTTSPGTAGQFYCSYDYVLIPQGSAIAGSTGSDHRDRYCGDYLAPANPAYPNPAQSTAATGGAVYSVLQPFLVGFYTDGQEIGIGGGDEEASAGFRLQYTQAACT